MKRKKLPDPYAALCALGDTSQKIATSLGKKKIRGMRNNYLACPVTKYLEKLGFKKVETHLISIRIWDTDQWKSVDLPSGVQTFIDDFDRGAYEELSE